MLKVKLIRKKIEIFEEMPIVNGWDDSYCCLYGFIVDFNTLQVKLTKEKMHPYNVWIISNVWLLKFKLISQKNWNIRRTAHCKWMRCILLPFILFYSWFPPFKSEIDKGDNAPNAMCGLQVIFLCLKSY